MAPLNSAAPAAPDKADYTYYSGNVLGDLAAVDTLSYDWYRDSSSTAPGHLNPVFRLIVYDSVAAEYSYLIWEGVYNDYTASNLPTDTWTTEDILGGNFWQWNITQSAGVFEFDHDLSYWVNELNDASVVGLNVGIGSGWSDSFLGFADNVTIGFTGADATCWNFESTPVPEPATVLMLSGLGIGLTLGRRRKKK